MDIKEGISEEIANKIFGKVDNSKNFLLELQKIKKFDLEVRKFKSGKKKGKTTLDLKKDEVLSKVIEHWDYKEGRKIIREIFKKTEKYKLGKKSYKLMKQLIKEWERLRFGELKWSFSQGAFDRFVQGVNSKKISRTKKDKKVKLEATKYRRIKEINTVRNDFIETLIFENNENVIPTLKHSRSIDFFINGISFDQKVAKSPTKEFKEEFGQEWKTKAIENPEKVAEFLYTYQDIGRFGDENRLLIVYLDEDISFERIEEIIQNTVLEIPLAITFAHKDTPDVNRQVNCYVILLFNEA